MSESPREGQVVKARRRLLYLEDQLQICLCVSKLYHGEGNLPGCNMIPGRPSLTLAHSSQPSYSGTSSRVRGVSSNLQL